MSTTFQIFLALNALFFLFYGVQSLNSQMMIDEFKRFGLSNSQRRLTGVLQILGSAGLLTGFIFPYVGLLAASGFTAMMLIAFIVRLKIKDNFAQSAPSFFFMLVNALLAIAFFDFINTL